MKLSSPSQDRYAFNISVNETNVDASYDSKLYIMMMTMVVVLVVIMVVIVPLMHNKIKLCSYSTTMLRT